jgi:SAM-dependent methyltransferase
MSAVLPAAPPRRTHKCRLCGATVDHTFVDLGMSPLCESFISAECLDCMEPYFPLHALVCGNCFLVQLGEYVSPRQIFSEYAYFSSFSTSWVAHAKAYCEMIVRRFGLGAGNLVLELGSNDGYLLQHFLPLGIRVLGVEPAANVARVATQKGIPTRVAFFGVALAQRLMAEGYAADLILGNNVLAHVPDLNDFVGGIRLLLKPEGVITLEFPHLQRLIEGNQFDTIYHEHFSYFSFTTVAALAARHGLRLIDVEELATHGGSIRVYLAHRKSVRQPSKEVGEMLDRERQLGFYDLATYGAFAERVRRTKRKLLAFLVKAKDEGRSICGYGAPGKGNTLLNYCGIGVDFLDFTVDLNPYKHGMFTPGMHIPIHDVEAVIAARPNHVLILPWNLRDEITRQMRHIEDWGGTFVLPIPEVEIIDPKTLPE